MRTATSRMQPDYSRQILLKDVGAAGQATLAASRVLIVGAGGLGSPVLQYLAGAGVGFLGLVEADVLQASNLHRQPIYELAQVGEPKAALAARGGGEAQSHGARRDACRALRPPTTRSRLVRAHDIVVDCTDNFRTKFLINDAAVLAERPAVFASVYQYEGQLQVYQPLASHACLRCLWPDATADGIVGNCAEAGVLGPVPGAFGALQALLTLKILLDDAGTARGRAAAHGLHDFHAARSSKRRAGANASRPHCALVRELERDDADIEIALDSLEEAAAHVPSSSTCARRKSSPPGPPRRATFPWQRSSPIPRRSRRTRSTCSSAPPESGASPPHANCASSGFGVRSLAGGLQGLRH